MIPAFPDGMEPIVAVSALHFGQSAVIRQLKMISPMDWDMTLPDAVGRCIFGS